MFSLETALKYTIFILLLAIVLGVLLYLIIFKKKEGFVDEDYNKDGSDGPKTVDNSIDVSIIHPASIMHASTPINSKIKS